MSIDQEQEISSASNVAESSCNDKQGAFVGLLDDVTQSAATFKTSPAADTPGLVTTGRNSPTRVPPNCQNTNDSSLQGSVSSTRTDFPSRPENLDPVSTPDSEIIFLEFEKPWAERSPIVISSDSEDENEAEIGYNHNNSKQTNLVVLSSVCVDDLTSTSGNASGDSSWNNPLRSGESVLQVVNRSPEWGTSPPPSPGRQRKRKRTNSGPESDEDRVLSAGVLGQQNVCQLGHDGFSYDPSSSTSACLPRQPDERFERNRRQKIRQEPHQSPLRTNVGDDLAREDENDRLFYFCIFAFALLAQLVIHFRLH